MDHTPSNENRIRDLSENSINDLTMALMSSLSYVEIDLSEFEKGKMSTEELIKRFLEGYKLQPNNIIFDNSPVQNFGLMICRNPLEDKKELEYFTQFSTKEVSAQNKLLTQIYNYYLTQRPDLHVDTMVNICYSGLKIVKNGVCLVFDKQETRVRKISTMLRYNNDGGVESLVYPAIVTKCLDIISKVCEVPKKEKNSLFLEIDKDIRLSKEKLGSILEGMERVFDEYTKDLYNTEDDRYFDYVNAFLDTGYRYYKNKKGHKLSQMEITKNLMRISVINQLAVPGVKYLYYIPILFPGENNKVKQTGHFTLFAKKDLTEKEIQQFKMLAFVLMFPLAQTNSTVLYLNSVRKFKVKSAVTSIMARNLSHNYGSHVLNHLLQAVMGTFMLKKKPDSPYEYQYQGLEPEKEIKENFQQAISLIRAFFRTIDNGMDDIDDETFKDVINNAEPSLQEALLKVNNVMEVDNLTNETIRQIVYLLNHVKCRVDYISDISFGAPMLQTSRWVYGDIFKELDRVTLLMNHISGLEKQFKYRIEIRGPRGILNDTEDLQVAVPNDVVGTHAFYNILENIIRNTAKHGNFSEDETVVFHVDFSEIPEKILNDDEELKINANQYYCVEIYDNVIIENKSSYKPRAALKLASFQNKSINEPVFNGERPRSQALGLVEMAASAAYLRKLDSVVIDDEAYHTDDQIKSWFNKETKQFYLLKAIPKEEGQDFVLGYRFFMLKPFEVLLVGGPDKFHLLEDGVWSIDTKVFTSDLEADKVFNYEFVVCFDDAVLKTINAYTTAHSPRVLKLGMDEIDGLSANEITDLCWKKWWENNQKKWTIKNIHCQVGPPKNNEAAVYLRHIETQSADDIFCDDNNKYVEAFSSLAAAKLPGFTTALSNYPGSLRTKKDPQSPFQPNANFYRNLEAVNNKILVVDERIQDAAENQKVFKHFLWEHYRKMNVTVPRPSKIDLLAKNYKPIAKSIKEYIETNSKDHDFVLIHYGLLERIFKALHNNDWKPVMDKYLLALSKESRIVITSGRGVPEELPPYVGFVSLSSVTSALIDYKSKYLINSLLYAARKSK